MKKGDHFQEKFDVTEQVYKGFIEIFRDKNPLHTDIEFARQRGFDSEVMHGNILNGFVSYFVGECLPTKSVMIQTQEMKFVRPVYLNDQLTFHAQVEDVFESVQTVQFKFYFSNNKGVKVAKGKVQIGMAD